LAHLLHLVVSSAWEMASVVCQGSHGGLGESLAALILAMHSNEAGTRQAKLSRCAQPACVVGVRQAARRLGSHPLIEVCGQRAVTARHWRLQERLQASAVDFLQANVQVSGEHPSVHRECRECCRECREGWHLAATWRQLR